MSEELYQELIVEHSRTPLNYGKLLGCCDCTHLQNPLCGDEIDLCVSFENGRIADCKFEGFGCSISKAAASILSEEIKGKTIAEVDHLIASYHALLTSETDSEECRSATSGASNCELGDLVVFGGVRQFPTRIRCATLAVEALAKLIKKHSVGQHSD
jgi:nitrogen fixation protein NifU and related proteins